MMSKFDRRNQAKQKRLLNHQQHTKAISIFSGKHAAPRLVAVIPLCDDVNVATAIAKLNSSVDLTETVPESGLLRVSVERFKQNVAYLTVRRDLLAVLDACRLADFVVLALSASEEVDTFGELLIKSIQAQGISNVVTVVEVRMLVLPADVLAYNYVSTLTP
jgi:pre-rRNA-processing protein TSR1